MFPLPLVPRGRLYSHLAKRGGTGARTKQERKLRSDRSGSLFCDGEGELAYTAHAPHWVGKTMNVKTE